jgi:uncharacterized protein with GYD domain
MPTYVTFFTYTGEAWSGMLDHPEDRAEAARTAIESAGGRLHCFYWMMGFADGFAVYTVPDEIAAAGLLAAVAGSGRVARQQTFQVLGQEEARRALERAGALSSSYRPPGEPAEWMAQYDELG